MNVDQSKQAFELTEKTRIEYIKPKLEPLKRWSSSIGVSIPIGA
jgi:hypothetical protein